MTSPSTNQRDDVGVLEEAYALDRPHDTWLAELTRRLEPVLGDGLGIEGHRLRVTPRLDVFGRVAIGASSPPLGIAQVAALLPPQEQGTFADMFLVVRHTSVVAQFGAERVTAMAPVLGYDPKVRDVLGLVLPDPAGVGFLFCAPQTRPVALSPGAARRITRLGTHLLAAARLREATDEPEAILTADGRVVHAEGEARSNVARERLRASAKAIDRARSKLRHRDPDEAISLWRGLVDGQWSLVDKFDADGRRFVVARRNEPEVRQLRALTKRESLVAAHAATGLQLKAIAYALGLPLATVATVLERALGKLGVGSRAELAALLGAVGGERGNDG